MRHSTGAVLDHIQQSIRAEGDIIGQRQLGRLWIAQVVKEFPGVTENEHPVIDGVRNVDLSIQPGESAWALEFTGTGSEAPKFTQPFAFAGELLDSIMPAVFADIEILRRILADADGEDELASSGSFAAEVPEPVSVRVEVDDPMNLLPSSM